MSYRRAEPVRITKPDGSSHVVSAHDLRQRSQEAAAPAPPDEMVPDDAVTQAMLEQKTMSTLFKIMRDSEKFSERTSAATAAVKFLAIKYKIGPAFGADLDDDDTAE